MPVKNLQLHNALRAYVVRCVSLLAGLCEHENPMNFELPEWREVQPGRYVLKHRQQLSWRRCIDEHLEALHATDEYSNLISMLRNDPVIGPQVDSLVGTALGRTLLDLRMLTDNFIGMVVDKVGQLQFDENTFREAYEAAESALHRRTVDVVTVAPLPNLDSSAHPVKLEANVIIDAMTDWEVSRGISAGFFRHNWAVFETIDVPSRCAVRHRLSLPKLWGDQPSPPGESYHLSARDAVARAISAIRIIKGVDVFSPGYFTYSDHWLLHGGLSSTLPTGTIPWFAPKHGLSQVEMSDLPILFSELGNESVTSHGPLNNAIRRYEYAGERQRPEDRIIDLMIAAESLFLHGSGSAQERGELRYRLAIRTAFFVGSSSLSRHQVFDLMRRAYDVRSKIVHGDPPTSVRLNEETLSLQELAVRVEETIRLALRKMIRNAVERKGARSLVDWEELILK